MSKKIANVHARIDSTDKRLAAINNQLNRKRFLLCDEPSLTEEVERLQSSLKAALKRIAALEEANKPKVTRYVAHFPGQDSFESYDGLLFETFAHEQRPVIGEVYYFSDPSTGEDRDIDLTAAVEVRVR